ncbi:bifunctional riboflavin kinase/FAD synthetase [Faecalicatena contorta]|uniref:Riboflavin biosynthesis protein n=1 Tax=Faecalicatena contorta TaxID=39482 RepID=A0A316A3J3_9FIRM|nr:bifunctional riboflavin kinase/FAD synthetase [Faecalicatena contorta]PWJ52093.1 riboflavin kinase/FMN adenylyltransferase [Faecalicatena contorta]SUQ12371.1 riboflavin kinase / FMN adenylyltransferase [Faecalicatena contorta]
MQYYTDINSYQGLEKTAVTLGKFDSLHRGHQRLVKSIQSYAQKKNVKSVVFAFDINKETLLTNQERRNHLETQVDCMIQCPFTKEIREMEAEAFIEKVLVEKLHASYIVVGTDFHFGHRKRGNVEMLARYAEKYHYQLDVLNKELYQGREISSTYVRAALAEGDVELANLLLGYPYHMSGVVEHGKRLGRTLGFPTMNIIPADRKIVPRYGVYTCKIWIEGEVFTGIGNVGMRPTVTEEKRVLLEVFVFEYDGDAYGKNITVEFCAFERPEKKFDSIEEMKRQVDLDIAFGKAYFQE